MNPFERCLAASPHHLSLQECLGLLLDPPHKASSPFWESFRASLDGKSSESETQIALFNSLELSPHSHLPALVGLSPKERARILAALEIGRRYALHREQMRVPAKRPTGRRAAKPASLRAVEMIPLSWRNEPREWLGFVPLYRNGMLGELGVIEIGQRTHVNTDPAELFARILALRPRGFYLFHNHPSGDLNISPADYQLTRQIKEVGRTLQTPLLGHAVITLRRHVWIEIEQQSIPSW